MNIGFALITSSSFLNKLINIENKVHDKYDFQNKLGLTTNLPHITIFQGSFVENTNYSLILKNIKEYYINNTTNHTLSFDKVVYVPHGWYFYICKKAKELQNLHMFTLNLCKDYLSLQPDRMNINLNNLTKEQINGMKKYGYRYSENAFYPHITLGRNNNGCNESIIKELNDKLSLLNTTVPIDKITVYRMGENGTHAETLDEIAI